MPRVECHPAVFAEGRVTAGPGRLLAVDSPSDLGPESGSASTRPCGALARGALPEVGGRLELRSLHLETSRNSVPIVKKVAAKAGTLVIAGTVALLGLWLADRAPGMHNGSRLSGEIRLTCAESAGQQGRGGESVVGGVEGLVLPGSSDPSALNPIIGPAGRRYYVYKAFLAVASSDTPFATVSIVSPPSARLYYGSPDRLLGDRALVSAARKRVRLPVCGKRFSGYVGGIVLVAPSRVTFEVNAPRRRAVRVGVSIGTG